MKRLLQINITANSGSHGKIAEEIGQLVQSKGWDSYISYGRFANPSKSHLIRIGGMWDERWHALESRFFDNHGLASRLVTKLFIKRIDELEPDIIHLHNIHGYYLNFPILFKYLGKINVPVVWTLHDCWPFTGHCAFFDYAGCERWKTGCYASCPCKSNYPKSIFLDRSCNNWHIKKQYFTSLRNLTLVPVSNWLERMVLQSFLGHYPIRVIHNGIDINVFKPSKDYDEIRKKFKIPRKKLILGVANVWEERKGLNDFLKLRSLMSDEYVIVLVGLKKNQISSLPEGIIGITHTQDQYELARLYSTADVFLNPTYEDNYPTTNLEAMACGTPVVTYKTGGSPEAVSEDTGLVIQQGELAALFNASKYICEKGKDSWKDNCRKRAELFFDNTKCFNKYVDIYDSLI